MLPRPTESSLAQVLRTMLGMISGPTALDVFRLDKSFSTPLDSIIMFLMDGIFLFDKSGRMLSFTLVNTDWNCLTKMSAFPLESDIKFPFCFKGDTPMLSCFLHLTYFQNGLEFLLSRPFVAFVLYIPTSVEVMGDGAISYIHIGPVKQKF